MTGVIPRLTSDDLDALRALSESRGGIAPVSRYWLSVYELIDETPAGWVLTARGRALLDAPVVHARHKAAPREQRVRWRRTMPLSTPAQ